MKNLLLIFVCLIPTTTAFSQCFSEANAYTFNYNGHTYKIIKENKTWTEAVNCALSTNGYLAEIEDAAEENAIFSALTNDAGIDETFTQNEFGTAAVWLGGSDSQNEGIWIWDGDNDNNGTQFWNGDFNGSPVNGAYTNWGTTPTEPDNSGDQDKLTLTIDSNHPNYGKWNDLANLSFNTLYYVIEYNDVLSVGENTLKHEINVYPNPIKNWVNIQSPVEISSVVIFNAVGQEVYEQETNSDTITIDLSNMKSSIYYLKVIFKDGSIINYKLVK